MTDSICYLDEKDIGATVTANGLALDCPRFSGGRYAEYEVKGAAALIRGRSDLPPLTGPV